MWKPSESVTQVIEMSENFNLSQLPDWARDKFDTWHRSAYVNILYVKNIDDWSSMVSVFLPNSNEIRFIRIFLIGETAHISVDEVYNLSTLTGK